LRARLGGLIARALGSGRRNSLPADPAGLLVPEIFQPAVAASLPSLFAEVKGPRGALFYDAVALKLPEMTPASIVARYPSYLRELLAFDGIAAISADARDALLDYWRWLEVGDHPEVVAVTLGVERPKDAAGRATSPVPPRGTSAGDRQDDGVPVVLSVGSLEGRKNHLALLEASERLWAEGMRFELRLIGPERPETGHAAGLRLRALRAAGRPLRYDGVVGDAALNAAYAGCSFTVYPSLMEGFGLPVAESLVRGKPCICSGNGALGESARGGGCLALGSVDAAGLAEAMRLLLSDPATVGRLAGEARARTFKTPGDYAREIKAWMAGLRRRR
jgi:glycosyltransferase involved in cell wall biosynthesis